MIRSSRSERPGMMHRWALVVNSTSKSAKEGTPEKKDDENKEPPREESGSDGRKSDRRDSKSRKRRG